MNDSKTTDWLAITQIIVVSILCMAVFLAADHASAQNDPPIDFPNSAGNPDEQSNPDLNQLPLPRHGVWRFGEIENPDANGYFRVEFSPDGSFLAARNRKNTVEIRDVHTRQLICEASGFTNRITGIDFSPDSRHFLTFAAGSDEGVKIREVKTGRLVSEIDSTPVHAVFSSSGDVVFVLEKARLTKHTWPNGNQRRSVELQGTGRFRQIVSRDGRFVIAAREIKNGRVFLTKCIDVVNDSSVIMDGPAELPKQIIISRDNNWAAATYPRKDRIHLWNMRDPTELTYVLRGHEQTVQSIAFSYDNRLLVSTGWDKRVIIWDLLTREIVGKLKGHGEHVNGSAFHPDTMSVATAASGIADSTVIVWSLDDFFFPGPPHPVNTDNFEATWNRLGNSRPLIALAAVNDLRHSIDETFELIRAKIGTSESFSRNEICGWIKALDAETFAEREQATRQLITLRGRVERLLLEAFEDAPSTEVQYRINRILREPVSRPEINVAELRRLHRSVYLLELIARNDKNRSIALKLLKNIADNHPHLELANQAARAVRVIELLTQ